MNIKYRDILPQSVVDELEQLIVSLESEVVGTLPPGSGGLGISTFLTGDLIYASALDTLARLAISPSAGTFLRSTGTVPAWSSLILPNSATTGDLLYASATNTLSNLPDVATGNALISGGVGVIPSWGKIGIVSHISAAAFTTGSIPFVNGSVLAEDNANLFFDDTNNTVGVGTTRSGAISGTNPRLRIKGSGATSATSTLELQNSAGDRSILVTDDLLVTIGLSTLNPYPFTVDGVTGHTAMGNNHFGVDALAGLKMAEPVWISGTNKLIFGSNATAAISGNLYQSIHGMTNGNDLTFRTYQHYIFETLTVGDGSSGTERLRILQNGGMQIQDGTSFRWGSAGVAQIIGVSGAGGYLSFSAHGSEVSRLYAGARWSHGSTFASTDPGKNDVLAVENFISIGTQTYPATGTSGLIFGDGTALASMASNTSGAFGDDVGGTVELFGINEAGNVAQLTGLNIRKTADESVTNSTAHQADDHLTVNLAASSSYQFEIWGFWTTAGATAGITVQLDGTAGVSSLKADVIHYINATDLFTTARITAFNSAVGVAGTGDNSFYIKGVIETSTAGTLFLEWAQNTADAVNATVLQENSYFILRKLNA